MVSLLKKLADFVSTSLSFCQPSIQKFTFPLQIEFTIELCTILTLLILSNNSKNFVQFDGEKLPKYQNLFFRQIEFIIF